jgi:ubiquinone biosynthesis accessory factor UbiJ
MPASPVWLAAIETVLNRSLDASLEASAIAARLSGTALRVEVEGLASIDVAIVASRLALGAGGSASAPDAIVTGTPLSLLRLLTSRGASGIGRTEERGAVRITGDAEIANRYRELIALARPDFEEELSRLVGDVAARRLSLIASGLASFAARVRRTAGENLAEYLTEESRDLASKAEVEEFLYGVDNLRETADRVDARLARLEQRLKGNA